YSGRGIRYGILDRRSQVPCSGPGRVDRRPPQPTDPSGGGPGTAAGRERPPGSRAEGGGGGHTLCRGAPRRQEGDRRTPDQRLPFGHGRARLDPALHLHPAGLGRPLASGAKLPILEEETATSAGTSSSRPLYGGDAMRIWHRELGDFGANCYVVACEET